MALIPPFFLDCVVAVGFKHQKDAVSYCATGFLYGLVAERSEKRVEFQLFLVTNRHVLEGEKTAWLRFNPDGKAAAREYRLDLFDEENRPLSFTHPDDDVDIAVAPLDGAVLQRDKIRFAPFFSDQSVLDLDGMRESGLTEGDGVFVLGFPMGLIGGERNAVIVRQGVLARVRDLVEGASKSFLVDTTIFPGNSGGPVVTRPEAIVIQGTKGQSKAALVGIVASYLTYKDIAVSQQSGRQKVVFEENAGLAVAYPVDFIREVVALVDTELKKRRQESPAEMTPPKQDERPDA